MTDNPSKEMGCPEQPKCELVHYPDSVMAWCETHHREWSVCKALTAQRAELKKKAMLVFADEGLVHNPDVVMYGKIKKRIKAIFDG